VITTHWTWQGTDDFLGSANRTRGHYEKSKVAFAMQLSIIFFLTDLDPDGCLAADHHEGACHTFEKTGADKQTGYFRAGW